MNDERDDPGNLDPEDEALRNLPPVDSDRMFQITESDLTRLEALLPKIMLARPIGMTNREKVTWRRIQSIILNVRWNYGPWGECGEIPADESE
jgi:hypothetical protein